MPTEEPQQINSTDQNGHAFSQNSSSMSLPCLCILALCKAVSHCWMLEEAAGVSSQHMCVASDTNNLKQHNSMLAEQTAATV